MSLDDELEIMEETGQTEAEQIDEESEIQDVEDNIDEYLGEDALETDAEHAYASFETDNESDYDGYDPDEILESEAEIEEANTLHSEGYHVEDTEDLEIEAIEMEIEEGDIYAYIVDEDDNELGFILIDENGDEQEYYYVDMDEYEIVDEESEPDTKVIRAEDGEEFDLGITREGIREATEDANAVFRDGKEVYEELKDAMQDISEGMGFLKKKR